MVRMRVLIKAMVKADNRLSYVNELSWAFSLASVRNG